MKPSLPGKQPALVVVNHQRTVPLDLSLLRRTAQAAVALSLDCPGKHASSFGDLEAVEISLVSDRVIARVHRRFMDLPGATDVITFAHGEIIVSATTAAREAAERAECVEREVLRYMVHGLLHLNGHEDAVPAEAAAMWEVQERIVAELWPV